MDELTYLHGFANHFSTEAIAGALPEGQNSPQKVPLNLYAEQLSGSPFTAPRATNRHSWLYRRLPSVAQTTAYKPYAHPHFTSKDALEPVIQPNPLRWNPQPIPEKAVDFFDSWQPWAVQENTVTGGGMIMLYACRASATKTIRYARNNDGELLIVPQAGSLHIFTELGRMRVTPGMIAVIPRGVAFKVELLDSTSRGYLLENQGLPLQLPELGPIGANGLANSRDFMTPVAAFEADDANVSAREIIIKSHQQWWHSALQYSPLDVVAWHGSLAPYCYELSKFNTMNTVSFDHADPSIFTVLTSPSLLPGTANIDFVLFPPRWSVAEHTFRPPYFHRNVMSEYMGLISGEYDAKAEGFSPGGGSLHGRMIPHGPDVSSYQKSVERELKPEHYRLGFAFMFEAKSDWLPCKTALISPLLQSDYSSCWQGFTRSNLS